MINTEKLKEIIEASGLPVAFLANMMNRSEKAAQEIIDGAKAPNSNDIAVMKAFLNLSNDEVEDIFFPDFGNTYA